MAPDLVLLESEGDIAIVRLNRGVTNALNLELVTELAEAVRTVRLDPALLGLVLTSTNEKFLSIGFDIPNLLPLSTRDFTFFYRAYTQLCLDLFTLPKPTAAAITGHAIAGGCILVLCCDCRFIAEGRKLIGLNEIKLGLPVPHIADCVLRALVGYRNARDVTGTGDFYPPEEALRLGLVDEVLPPQEVLPKCIDKLAGLGAMPGEAASMIKHNRVEPVEAEIRAGLEDRERSFVQCWYSGEARERLKEAAAKF